MDWILAYRTDFLTEFFLLFPHLVSASFFIFVIAIGYWGFNRDFYRDLGVMICLSTLVNVFLKMFFKIPRPDILALINVSDPLGFPSGDVMVATVFWLMLAFNYHRFWLWGLSIIMIILVMCSRMYLGVHSYYDVSAGAGLGMILTWLYFSLKAKPYMSSKLMHLLGFVFVLFISNWVFAIGYRFLLIAYGFLLGIMVADIIKLKWPLNPAFINYRYAYIFFGIFGLFVLRSGMRYIPNIGSDEMNIVVTNMFIGIALIWAFPKIMDVILIRMKKL